ncbi:acetylglutamate kinase [Kurthia zopfii]|uniref:Acetylglutamate kinase n=1 Tax=Kurthia zopfii TaxID=1650 RepID=A0A8B4QA37_9BACL|nr:acetylglutamate kinase [Kurthia zopfii]PWI22590.1 acetylglutamate kinase [Kurthia zopfii]TDR39048.1 N-acetylglutamate kinase [Kurthia zopfii]GEK31271.1 acetylglutamate kinase [Kurthia zopfii]STX09584.1 Acetylglutamate kinase [Kurthia zopfii]
MTMSKSTQPTAHKKSIVIKLGGSMINNLSEVFFRQLEKMQQQSHIVIVHGGGPAINEALANSGQTFEKINGIRVTPEQSIDLIASTLIGQVNPYLVGEFQSFGIQAIGLNGADGHLLKSDYLDQAQYGFVGKVTQVNTAMLHDLCEVKLLPVVACTGMTDDNQLLNINGDDVAAVIAKELHADELLFVTDIEGIQIQHEKITETDQGEIEYWIEQGYIYGGMIPKVTAATNCVKLGIPIVRIVGSSLTGTTIVREKVSI